MGGHSAMSDIVPICDVTHILTDPKTFGLFPGIRNSVRLLQQCCHQLICNIQLDLRVEWQI